LISQIFLYKNPSAVLDSLSEFVVTIVDNDNVIKFQNSTQSSDQVVKIIVPTVVYGSGVRISIRGDSKVLSIGEIELYDAQDDPVWEIDIPSGLFFDGRAVNYITFIQEHGEAGVSQFYNLAFV
jgi:NAD(P)H-hydrate repair Nnr-like enzyme with NAD(P)H-hydrate epimerase domain